MQREQIKELARECGFELAGIAAAAPVEEAGYYARWVADGFAGEMRYLTDRRAAIRKRSAPVAADSAIDSVRRQVIQRATALLDRV